MALRRKRERPPEATHRKTGLRRRRRWLQIHGSWGRFFKAAWARVIATTLLLSAGARLGKVITDQRLPGILRGQFEYAGELMPYWQSFTPAPHTAETEYIFDGHTGYALFPYGGGTFTGFSITPIIFAGILLQRGVLCHGFRVRAVSFIPRTNIRRIFLFRTDSRAGRACSTSHRSSGLVFTIS